jgi:hypothetical protein
MGAHQDAVTELLQKMAVYPIHSSNANTPQQKSGRQSIQAEMDEVRAKANTSKNISPR